MPLYPEFQAFFREYQPPALIVWGKNDLMFPAEGAPPCQRDLRNIEIYMLDTGHFALETHGGEIAVRIEEFLQKHRKQYGQARRKMLGCPEIFEGASDWMKRLQMV